MRTAGKIFVRPKKLQKLVKINDCRLKKKIFNLSRKDIKIDILPVLHHVLRLFASKQSNWRYKIL